jgi:hypothetical protein
VDSDRNQGVTEVTQADQTIRQSKNAMNSTLNEPIYFSIIN